jgi:hypothetical protein
MAFRAGLPFSRAKVCVGPLLFARLLASLADVEFLEVVSLELQLPSSEML